MHRFRRLYDPGSGLVFDPNPAPGAPPATPPAPSGENPPAPPADPPTNPPADPPTPDNAAFAAMRRRAAEAEAEAERLRKEAEERERREAEEQGRWKELAEQEKERADRLEREAQERERRNGVESAARTLGFRDPGYALYRLERDGVDLGDAEAVRTRLGEYLEADPTLAGRAPAAPPSGGPPPPPGGGAPKLTRAQIEAMKPEQIAALSAEELREALNTGA